MRFEIRAKPGAARAAVGGTWGDEGSGAPVLVVAVTAPPVDGKANAAIIAALAKAFAVPKRAVTIVRGEVGRIKLIEINGHEPTLTSRLAELLSAG